MKKIIAILVLGLVFSLFTSHSFAAKKIKLGQTYENEITYKGVTANLPPGEKWTVIGSYNEGFDSVLYKGYILAQLKGNKINGFIEIGACDDGGVYASQLNSFYQGLFFSTGKKKGLCTPDSGDLVYKTFRKGSSFNCFRVRPWDIDRGIYNPIPLEIPAPPMKLKAFIEKNNIEMPKMMLRSEHYYFSRRVSNKISWVKYNINQENYDSFKDKKKYTNNWIKLSAKRHKLFEEDVKAEKNTRSILDLNEFIGGENKPIETYMSDLTKVEKTKEKKEKLKKQKEKAEKEKAEKLKKQKEKTEKEEDLKKQIEKKKRELEQLEKEKKAEEKRKKIEEAKKQEELKRKAKEEKEKSKKKRKIEKDKTTEINVIEQIKELKKMHDEGVLTKEQFESAKDRILEK